MVLSCLVGETITMGGVAGARPKTAVTPSRMITVTYADNEHHYRLQVG